MIGVLHEIYDHRLGDNKQFVTIAWVISHAHLLGNGNHLLALNNKCHSAI